MTTLNSLLQPMLAPICAGGAYYQVNELQPPVYPYIVWTLAGGEPNVALDGRANLVNSRVQIDIFDQSVASLLAADAAFDAVIDASLQQPPGSTGLRLIPITEAQDLFEEPVRAHRRMRDFLINWSRT